MNSSASRSIEVDLLRGVIFFVIALDHTLSGLLRNITLHSYAYCDAAEGFVFLGGYASAAAYTGVAKARGEIAAKRRFLRRAWQIYRAYLITAALMLVCSAILARGAGLRIDGVVLSRIVLNPLHSLADIALFRRQPTLAGVLPMYVVFALCVPLTAPLARDTPAKALALSFTLWLFAPWLGATLPDATGEGWAFNPFAWQLMFTLGMLCRLHPVSSQFQVSNRGRFLTSAAFCVALAIALFRLRVDVHPTPGYMKQNLAGLRVVSFLAIAWLCAQFVRIGWGRALATRLTCVTTVGQQGLVCFVAGGVVSILTDTCLQFFLSRWSSATLVNWPIRLLGDAFVIVALLFIGHLSAEIKRLQAFRSTEREVIRSMREDYRLQVQR
ncbi:OpgC domain-containing protein [Paraburkholderia sp. Ac-20340]|uniref:OpgC domain-containing protein n=1 Tax=Paraburkholderia sp. Ac-20340 TaxID=2703888 RepID=UPI0019820EF3|nr:OpgC domain-containing protein [Paraburkholderia sp. Ac-20340]MBN3854035.1 OpgC domain-containing protein [Paraburkholderia sp. Ac-20340]